LYGVERSDKYTGGKNNNSMHCYLECLKQAGNWEFGIRNLVKTMDIRFFFCIPEDGKVVVSKIYSITNQV
jgi:hypothetical protein